MNMRRVIRANRLLAEQGHANDTLAALDEMARLRKNAARYEKLRGWMSSNVKEGWKEVEQLAAIACYVDWSAFDESLDDLPECNVGLMSKPAVL